MTNEQLAVLLQWIADSIDKELHNLNSYLISLDGVERKANLYKDGEYHGRAVDRLPFDMSDWSDEGVKEWAEERGYEVHFDGDPIILDKLTLLLNRLRGCIRTLRHP